MQDRILSQADVPVFMLMLFVFSGDLQHQKSLQVPDMPQVADLKGVGIQEHGIAEHWGLTEISLWQSVPF